MRQHLLRGSALWSRLSFTSTRDGHQTPRGSGNARALIADASADLAEAEEPEVFLENTRRLRKASCH